MSRRKRKVQPETEATEAIFDEEGFLCLRGVRLWKWRALSAEHRASTLELRFLNQEIRQEIDRHPELKALLERQRELLADASQVKAELDAARLEIESAFGVSLNQCSFDDKTGRLYNLAADGQPTPSAKESTDS